MRKGRRGRVGRDVEGGEGWGGMWKEGEWRGEEGKAKCFLDICLPGLAI